MPIGKIVQNLDSSPPSNPKSLPVKGVSQDSQTLLPGLTLVYFGKSAERKVKAGGDLILKEAHPNLTLSKVNKLNAEKRFGFYDKESGNIKLDENWINFLQEHNVKQVVYKNKSGDKEILKNVNFQTLTGEESEKLNSAISELYLAILNIRIQLNEEKKASTTNNSSFESIENKSVAFQTQTFILPPSIFLKMMFSEKQTQSAQEQDRIKDKIAKEKYEEKKSIDKSDRIKSQNLKFEENKETNSKHELNKNSSKKDRANLGSQKSKENIRIKP